MESPEHNHLKNIALLWLLNQGCFLVEREVPLSQLGLRRYTDLDTRTVIDALGVGMRHNERNGKETKSEEFDINTLAGSEVGECILRGVEVKVSRGDFRAGFACSGCNYHYVLTPLRLLNPVEVPKGIGLIEYNRHKFACEPNETHLERPYKITGIRVLKPPTYRWIPRFQVDGAIAHIASRVLEKRRQATLEEALSHVG